MFVHLHVHSHYSLLDAACKIDDLLKACKAHGMPACALTDHGNLFGAVEFYTKAREAGIKPIVGCEVYMAPGSRFERERGADGDSFYHLVLLAKDLEGYRNLSKLVSAGYQEGFYYKPRIDKEILATHAAGLIGLSACLKSEVLRHFLLGREEEAERSIFELSEILGRENYYLEMMDHGIPEQKKANAWLAEMSKKTGLGLVVTNDIHYMDRSDSVAHDVLLCIGTGKTLSDEKRRRYSSDEFYFKSGEEMARLFPDHPEAVSRTKEVADRCNLVLPLGEHHYPVFESDHPGGSGPHLRALCEAGVRDRYKEGAGSEEVVSRLERELSVIDKQGFVNYFLIVWDFVRFARSEGIPVGPGRGSAAGSIVAYSLGITDIDPLKYDLLFERFLNPGRNEPPDIDIDFCERRREEVIRYVRDKYGERNVCQIITFGKLLARAVVRDVGRVLEVPLPEVDALAKKIPMGVGLRQALEQEPELEDRYRTDPKIKQLIDIAERLEGLCRHASTHAAGVVISDKPLTEYVPLYVSKGEVTTQFDMNHLVMIGLLKMDFLGLKNLTIIDKTLSNVRASRGETVDLASIPVDDADTYALISRGETVGIFQLESSGMRDLMQKLKPDVFEDLIAAIAIYRPGPLGSGMVDSFVAVKHGRQKAQYLHPELEPILKETHGMILYQEQAMRITNRLAGFSLVDADHLRKAMSKKKEALMAEYREQFVEGAVERGKNREVAEKIFEQIRHFAGYGFNKSHSAAYAVLSYQTAYLKAHVPAEFMAGLLSVRADNTDSVVKLVEECRRMGIDVLPPDINESREDFTVVGGHIRFGLAAVKGVGDKAVQAVTKVREAGGPFASLFDFCRRIDMQAVNRKSVETLILAGAFDQLGPSRASLATGLESAYEAGTLAQTDRAAGQMTFFDTFEEKDGFTNDTLPDVPEWPERERLAHEKETLGFYLTSHPLARHERDLKAFSDATIQELDEGEWESPVLVGGMISSPSVKRVKSGKNAGRPFAVFQLADLTGGLEAVAFPDAYEKLKNIILEDAIVFVKGRLDRKGGGLSLYADEIIPVEHGRDLLADRVVISLGHTGLGEDVLRALKNVIQENPGTCRVHFEFLDPSGRRILLEVDEDFNTAPGASLEAGVKTVLGDGHLRYARSRTRRENDRRRNRFARRSRRAAASP